MTDLQGYSPAPGRDASERCGKRWDAGGCLAGCGLSLGKGRKGKLAGLVSRVCEPLPGPHEGGWLGGQVESEQGQIHCLLGQ